MRGRAIILGLLFVLFISVSTTFNSVVIGGTRLVTNYLPISAFGVVLLLLMFINPLPGLFKFGRPLKKSEIMVIAAFGLAACGWPGRGSMNALFYSNAAKPLDYERTEVQWQSQHVMSYVPGGSPLIARGHVADWNALSRRIVGPGSGEYGPSLRIRRILDDRQLRHFEEAAGAAAVSPGQIDALIGLLNRVVEDPRFYEREAFSGIELSGRAAALLGEGVEDLCGFQVKQLNRSLLVASFPDQILPPPRGGGLLLSRDEQSIEVLDELLLGRTEDGWIPFFDVPWQVFLPGIGLWFGTALVLGLAATFLAFIIHRQWYRHELLSYPLVRFLQEVSTTETDSPLPAVISSKMFWTAVLGVVAVRLLNGSAVWFEGLPEFPLCYDIGPLQEIFPNARRVPFSWIWQIRIYPTVIGFCFFLKSRDSFTLGMANFAWVVFGAVLIARGVSISDDLHGAEIPQMLRFGSYIGMAVMIIYTGRRYYAGVAAGALGLRRGGDAPGYSVWAARGLAVTLALAVLILHRAGLPVLWGALFVLVTMLIYLVMSRLVCEMGVILIQPWFFPYGVLTGLFGFEAIGPVPYVILALASTTLIPDPRNALMPFISTGLGLCEVKDGPHRAAGPKRVAPWLIVAVTGGLIVSAAAALYMQYNEGPTVSQNRYSMRALTQFARHLSDAGATGAVSDITGQSTLEGLSRFAPGEGALFWMLVGLGLVIVTAAVRLRISWWPIHPALFLLWGTWAVGIFTYSFLIGWAIKSGVVKVVGAKGYRKAMPIMIGIIAGDLFSALFWLVVGIVYYFMTGRTPAEYTIML